MILYLGTRNRVEKICTLYIRNIKASPCVTTSLMLASRQQLSLDIRSEFTKYFVSWFDILCVYNRAFEYAGISKRSQRGGLENRWPNGTGVRIPLPAPNKKGSTPCECYLFYFS